MSGPDGVSQPPPVPASLSGSTAGRSLRPDALPSDTAVRFVLLILAVATASLYLFQALWFVVRGGGFVAAVQRCGVAAGDLAGGLVGATSSELQRMSACRADVSREQAGFAVGGCLMVLGAAWLAYRWMPVWRQRRRHLVSPDSADGRALLDEVAALSAQAGLERSPAVRLDAANPAVQAYVYGAGNELRLAMTGGLVVQQVLDPPSFRAVLRHELAHIKNRDVPWTYYTVAAWWSFVALALVPIAAVFVVNDPKYVLQLGWRTGLLALLVALVAASVLRAREAYADATSVTWSSIADLDRVLAAQPASRTRRPQLLRLHPSPHERRMLLAAPDRLFRADWFTAAATGVAAGTALASLESIASLVLPSRAVVLSLAVAPLIAVVACVTAWRVGLREAVRGRREPLALPLGLGLGAGLAVAPLLTFEAAAGGVANGRSGWAGYALWALGMALATALVVRWVADSARVRVESMIRFANPRRALAGHVLAVTVVIALLLACGHYARLLLVSLGPSVLSQPQLWQELPAVSIGFWPNLAPILAVAAALAVPLLAWRDLGRTTPSRTASWAWRDDGGVAGDRVDFPRLTRPHLSPILVVGVLAAGTAAIALIAARILTPLLPDEIRHIRCPRPRGWASHPGQRGRGRPRRDRGRRDRAAGAMVASRPAFRSRGHRLYRPSRAHHHRGSRMRRAALGRA